MVDSTPPGAVLALQHPGRNTMGGGGGLGGGDNGGGGGDSCGSAAHTSSFDLLNTEVHEVPADEHHQLDMHVLPLTTCSLTGSQHWPDEKPKGFLLGLQHPGRGPAGGGASTGTAGGGGD